MIMDRAARQAMVARLKAEVAEMQEDMRQRRLRADFYDEPQPQRVVTKSYTQQQQQPAPVQADQSWNDWANQLIDARLTGDDGIGVFLADELGISTGRLERELRQE